MAQEQEDESDAGTNDLLLDALSLWSRQYVSVRGSGKVSVLMSTR